MEIWRKLSHNYHQILLKCDASYYICLFHVILLYSFFRLYSYSHFSCYIPIFLFHAVFLYSACLGGSAGCMSDWRSGCCGFHLCQVSNILSWRLILKYLLWSFSAFHWFKKGIVSFWWKNVHSTGKLLRGPSLPSKSVVRDKKCKLTVLNMTLVGWVDCKTSTQKQTQYSYIPFLRYSPICLLVLFHKHKTFVRM